MRLVFLGYVSPFTGLSFSALFEPTSVPIWKRVRRSIATYAMPLVSNPFNRKPGTLHLSRNK